MEKLFRLKEHGTSVRTEVVAGLTTFMTMAYILALNPSILSASGMDIGAVFTATALASAIASFCMALFANLPFVLSAGLGLNAYFAYTVCGSMGYSWEQALTAVFVEGVIFIVLSLTNVREAIFNAIPASLKLAVSVGIGLFICFIGLQNAHIVVDGSTLVSLYSIPQSIADGTFRSEGICVILAIIGVVLMGYLTIRGTKGGILVGMLIMWAVGMVLQALGIYVPDPDNGFYSLFPSGIFSAPASMAPTAFKIDFSFLGKPDFFVVMFAFLFVDVFDTLGTLTGCASKAGMLDKDGKLPGIKGALLADSVGTVVGALFGTSTITTFVESSSGIAEGGRTGLTAVVSGGMFLLSLFLSPIFLAIPSYATAPALIIVGFLMMQQVGKIVWEGDLLEAIPAYICIAAMPFAYSISDGIAFGVISYTVFHLLAGKGKKVTPLMYVLAVLFLLRYFLI